MEKYILYFLNIIISFIGLYSFNYSLGLADNSQAISSIFTIIFYVFLFKLNIKYLFSKEKMYNQILIYILSTLFSFCSVVGYNLTKFNYSFLNKGITYFYILAMVPSIASLIKYGLAKLNIFIDKIKKINFPKIDNLIFGNKKLVFIKCLIIILIAWLPVLLAFYPGIFSYDSSVQLNEVINPDNLSNNNPIIHTLILGNIIKLGKSIFNSYNIGIFIYTILQILILATVLSIEISYLNKKKCSFTFKIITLLIFMFMPAYSVMGITATKDIVFSAFFSLYFIKIVEMCTNTNEYFKSKLNIVLTIILAFLFLIFRHNGYYAYIVFIPFCILILRKHWKKLLIILLFPIILYNTYLNIVNDILNITPEKFPSAVLCVPVQQLARTYNLSSNLTELEKEKLDKLKLEENSYQYYEDHKVDSVMWKLNMNIITNNISEYIDLYLSIGSKNINTYIDAFLANTIGYWYIGDELPDDETYRTYIEIRTRDDFNNTNDEIKFESKLPILYNFYFNMIEKAQYKNIPVISTIANVAFNIWILIISTFYILYKKNYKNLVPLLLFYGLLVTLFIGPVAILRYAYPIFISLPIILFLCFDQCKEN